MKYINVNSAIDLGLAIKTRRKELGISQKDLAAYCDVAKNVLTKIENAQSDVRVSTLYKISKLLGFKLTLDLEE